MKVRRFCSALLLCFCLILSKPFSALADTATSSNAVMTMDLSDEDYGIMPLSSVGTATNTIDWEGVDVQIGVYDTVAETTGYVYKPVTDFDSSGMSFKYTLDGTAYDDDKYVIRKLAFVLEKSNIPVPGDYLFSWDVSSNFSYDIYTPSIWVRKNLDNASDLTATFLIAETDYTFSSGDFACLDLGISLGSVYQFIPSYWIRASSGLRNLDFTCRIGFNVTSGDYPTVGTDTSTQDYQSDVSSSLSDLSSSVGSLTEDMSSAAENLEYISTSQNLIIQGIDNVIMHISDQLYAFWDQLYNLIHEPTYAKLEEILAALKAIANNSDIYAVVEEVREANEKEMANDNANADKVIANDNANTDKVTDAVEKHGNFIIEGLKSLFIPSDDYFSSLFDDLNEFFKERFGFLYTPIDLLVRFIDLIYGADAEFTGIPFPELKWDGYVLLEAQTVGFDILEVEEFKNVQNILYFLTNLAMIGALISLIHKKFEEVMRN